MWILIDGFFCPTSLTMSCLCWFPLTITITITITMTITITITITITMTITGGGFRGRVDDLRHKACKAEDCSQVH